MTQMSDSARRPDSAKALVETIAKRRRIAQSTLLVDDYDRAIAYFTCVLGFYLIEDTPLSAGKRWVCVAPSPDAEFRLLLAEARRPAEIDAIGDQAGGRVALFLETDDFNRDYANFRARGVAFEETPRHETYGVVAVFRDLWGNRWDLIQYNGPSG